jgi:hypothetical protein
MTPDLLLMFHNGWEGLSDGLNFEDFLVLLLATVPFGAIWASVRLYRWHKRMKSQFLWGLFLASVATDVAAIPIAFIAARRALLGEEAPVLPGTALVLAGAILLLEGIFIYLVIRWRDLDHLEAMVAGEETQNQREDRHFGDQRRRLEEHHTNGEEGHNAED